MIDRQRFRSYLAAQDPDRQFERRAPDGCPIACYLREERGIDAMVGGLHYYGPGEQRHALPTWAHFYILNIGTVFDAPISARLALTQLDAIPAEW